MTPLPPDARDMLAKLCGMLGSDYDGERAVAAAKATSLLRRHGLTWSDLFQPDRASPDPDPRETDWWMDLGLCQRHADLLTTWEADFIISLGRFTRLSAKQRACLGRIVERLRKGGAR